MVDRELQSIRRAAVRAALPDDLIRQERANKAVVQQDHSLSSQALSASLPWAARDIRLPGALGVGTAFTISYPQACTLRRWEIHPGVVATTSTSITLQVDGVNRSSLYLPAGASTTGSNERITIPAGAMVAVTVSGVGGSQDSLFSLFTSGGA